MKQSGDRFLIAYLLLLLLVFILRFADATESDLSGVTTPAIKSEPVADLSGEKKVQAEALPEEEKDHAGEVEKGKKEENLEKKSEEGSSNGEAHVEECDPANRCVDEKSKFVACLRVPGKDSLDLSLLIQNKGKGSLDVSISAPDFVILEYATVQLNAKDNKEVKFSVKDGGNNNAEIVLKAGEGSCSLNFQNTDSDPNKKTETSAVPRYVNRLPIHSFVLIILPSALLVVLVFSYIRFRRIKSQEGSSKYQHTDALLPVSTGGKKDVNEGDGWDNSWGDGWDDEEAPMTPSKPVLTPSSKGLASRKYIKDSWKD